MDGTIFQSFSPALQAYAVSQLDPYHDVPYRLTGAPSDQSANSICMVVNQERTLSAADFGISTAAGDKWDLHVAILPVLQQASYYSGYLGTSCKIESGGSPIESPYTQLYPISCHGVSSADPTFHYDTGIPEILGVNTQVPGYNSTPGQAFLIPRQIRVIGASFEVVDETPTMYQQGSVTVYTAPSNTQESSYVARTATKAGGASNETRCMASDLFSGPPNRIQQATVLPESRTWKAKEGAYVIGRKAIDCIPFKRPTTSNQVLYSAPDYDTPQMKKCFFSREWWNGWPSSSANTWFDSFNMVTHYNISGAYFTGLSSQYGTYRLRTKLMYEIIPDPLDSSLVSLATPTLPRDPFFEKLLSECINALPPGVPQTSNPKGEFWATIKGTIRKVAGLVKKGTQIAEPFTKALQDTTGLPVEDLRQGVQTVAKVVKQVSGSPPNKGVSRSAKKRKEGK